jgi:signal transduction histidine kinase
MTEVAFLLIGLAAGAAVGWYLGVRRGGKAVEDQLESLTLGLRAGNLPDPSRTSSSERLPIRALRELLANEWARVEDKEEDETLKALGKISTYLRHRVEAPLLGGLDGGAEDLQRGADEALGAVEDLEFFLEESVSRQDPVSRNLTDLVQEVTSEFTDQSDLLVKVRFPTEPIRVHIEPEPLKDAIFLLLHNAAEFGRGEPVEVTVATLQGKGQVRVQDGGPGFSAEALLKAMDPFYSTSPGGLGLGLPHARKIVNRQGGEVFLRNADGGGAEVEIQIPLTTRSQT